MKIYFDDIRYPPSGWTLARTITEAINLISIGSEITHISLDHDLSHPWGACAECACPVAHYIAQKYRDAAEKPVITLHTSNPSGAREMQSILKNEGGLESTFVPSQLAVREE